MSIVFLHFAHNIESMEQSQAKYDHSLCREQKLLKNIKPQFPTALISEKSIMECIKFVIGTYQTYAHPVVIADSFYIAALIKLA